MKKTPPGTRGLIRKYLQDLKSEEVFGLVPLESEIAERIGPGNAVMVDGHVIAAHEGKICATISRWVFVYKRISIDNEDDKTPEIDNPLDNIEGEDLEIEIDTTKKEENKKKKRTKKKKKAVV